MNIKKISIALTLALTGAVGAAQAATEASINITKDLPAPLIIAKNAGMQIVKEFPAVSGLTGWVLQQGGQYSIVYTTADKQTLMAGALVDGAGHNLTSIYGDKYVPKPDYAAAYARLEHAASIPTGATAHPKSTVYVLFDPNCIFCHYVWEGLKPYEAAGLRVNWVPVAFLKPTSAGIAAAMLSAKDPVAAFEQNETAFNAATETGGLAALGTVPGDVIAKVKGNNALMSAFGTHGTPTIVWTDAHGTVQVKDGMPRLSDLPAITGLPAQPEASPDLARFR